MCLWAVTSLVVWQDSVVRENYPSTSHLWASITLASPNAENWKVQVWNSHHGITFIPNLIKIYPAILELLCALQVRMSSVITSIATVNLTYDIVRITCSTVTPVLILPIAGFMSLTSKCLQFGKAWQKLFQFHCCLSSVVMNLKPWFVVLLTFPSTFSSLWQLTKVRVFICSQ